MGSTEMGSTRNGSTRNGSTEVGRRLRAFLAFLYDFVIGDDWRIAVGVVVGLALTYALGRAGVPAWWLLPVLLAVLLPASLWLAVRRR